MILALCRITEIIRHGFSIGLGKYSEVLFLEIIFDIVNLG